MQEKIENMKKMLEVEKKYESWKNNGKFTGKIELATNTFMMEKIRETVHRRCLGTFLHET
jgi:hypothetical protein